MYMSELLTLIFDITFETSIFKNIYSNDRLLALSVFILFLCLFLKMIVCGCTLNTTKHRNRFLAKLLILLLQQKIHLNKVLTFK